MWFIGVHYSAKFIVANFLEVCKFLSLTIIWISLKYNMYGMSILKVIKLELKINFLIYLKLIHCNTYLCINQILHFMTTSNVKKIFRFCEMKFSRLGKSKKTCYAVFKLLFVKIDMFELGCSVGSVNFLDKFKYGVV